jgi:hypothetical protein
LLGDAGMIGIQIIWSGYSALAGVAKHRMRNQIPLSIACSD